VQPGSRGPANLICSPPDSDSLDGESHEANDCQQRSHYPDRLKFCGARASGTGCVRKQFTHTEFKPVSESASHTRVDLQI
jgi:hypothetical protein